MLPGTKLSFIFVQCRPSPHNPRPESSSELLPNRAAWPSLTSRLGGKEISSGRQTEWWMDGVMATPNTLTQLSLPSTFNKSVGSVDSTWKEPRTLIGVLGIQFAISFLACRVGTAKIMINFRGANVMAWVAIFVLLVCTICGCVELSDQV